MPLGVGATTSPQVEVLSAYAATNQTVAAVAATPGWNVIGAFFMPGTALVRLDLFGSVSDAALSMRARLFDLSTAQPVSGSTVTITSLTDVRKLSAQFSLTGNRTYQIQLEVTGGSGGAFFGSAKSASITN